MNRIPDQIREELVEARPITEESRWIFGEEKIDFSRVEIQLQLGDDLLQDRFRIDVNARMRCLSDSGKFEHIVEQQLHVPAGLLDPIEKV